MMLLEGLVAYTCLKGFCEESLNAYYVQNPCFKNNIEHARLIVEDTVKPFMEPVIVRYTFPLFMFAKEQKASIDLGNKKTLTIESGQSTSLKLTINF